MAYGYGAPLFNYYAPAAMYLPLGLHRLGMSVGAAYLAGVVFYALLGATGAYLLGAGWSRRLLPDLPPAIAGIATAVAYTYAPYMLLRFDLARDAAGVRRADPDALDAVGVPQAGAGWAAS